ncbi:MAG TPA: 4-hydroxybenzoate 3-monooxygenase [Rhizomicrobium sp.]|nr:4-hydroxybenzoate 3-monooxygenase [Rhizomicrobium sp.]
MAIIGGGPAGLFLALLLHRAGIAAIVLERQSRSHVEQRVRAGVLEQSTADLMHTLGIGERLAREGLVHTGVNLTLGGEMFRIDLKGLTGSAITIYGQQEVMKDLYDAAQARGIPVVFEAKDVRLHDIADRPPFVTFAQSGEALRVDCDFMAGCDGFHGISRGSIPAEVLRTEERTYPFAWLGILADVPPAGSELIYASHENGFALASMRSRARSRYYLQCAADEDVTAWSDARFWDELCVRLGPVAASRIKRGPSIEKSIAPVRSFRAEPMRHGNLFLAGDAAHIVPPIGAKGLNLAVSDVSILAGSLAEFYCSGSEAALDAYSSRAMARVRAAEEFSRKFLDMTHRFADAPPHALQRAQIENLLNTPQALAEFACAYAGTRLF